MTAFIGACCYVVLAFLVHHMCTNEGGGWGEG